ncbi:glycosyltransferase (plasmid) [Lactiplantibacillus plantarum subsp. plantarum]|uniref:glycosyltransferase n=1 Tax=Lactiplantibacillus plantarum TaxID=1590 RepID=UPI003F7E0641
MRILYVISTLTNCGPVNVLYSLCKQLTKKAKITILTLSPENEDSRLDDFVELGVIVNSLSLSRFGFMIRGKRLFNDFIVENDFNIIHSHGLRADQLVANCHVLVKISTAHNNPSDDYCSTYGRLLGHWMTLCQLRYWKKMTMVVACSSYIENQIRINNITRIMTIHNGTPSFDGNLDDKNNAKVSQILVLGSLSKRKNVEFVLQAFMAVKLASNKLCLNIVGDGPQFDDLVNKYASENIKFIGKVSDPTVYLASASWLVSASQSEGLPMAVMEGLSANCNILLSDIGPHEEIMHLVNDQQICQLFPLNKVDLLMKFFTEIATGALDWHDGARLVWERNFSETIMGHNYYKLYQQVISNS